MRVLVTGCFGYLGPVIVRHLKAAGHYVIGLDTGWFLPNYAEMPTWPHYAAWTDLRDIRPADVGGECPDVIVHLAGLSNDPLGDIDEALTQRINDFATLELIASTPQARHVIVSSCSVYGHTEDIATEDTPVNPLTAYARAKAEVDKWAPMFAAYGGVISLRLGTVWGYSPGHRLDLVVNRMMFDAIHSERVTAQTNAWRPLVHVEDVARNVTHYVENDATGIRNVVGENVQMQALAGRIADYVGVPATFDDGSADRRDYRARNSGLRSLHSVFNDDDLFDLFVNTQLLPVSAVDPTDRYTRLNSLRRLMNLGLLDKDLRRIT